MADPVVWGQLPKAQDDPTTIDDAISAAIVAHEADPTAHLGAGESLETHRANDIIDHPAQSVVRDKLNFSNYIIDDYFLTIDSWQKSGSVTLPSLGQVQLKGPSSGTGFAIMATTPGDSQEEWSRIHWNPNDEVLLVLETVVGILASWGTSDITNPVGYGFVVHNSLLYAYYYDSEEVLHETQIFSIDCTKYHIYRLEGRANGDMRWLIDGVQVHSANDISLDGLSGFFVFFNQAVTAHNKSMWVLAWHHDQDFPV
jgi:hypothetical protein